MMGVVGSSAGMEGLSSIEATKQIKINSLNEERHHICILMRLEPCSYVFSYRMNTSSLRTIVFPSSLTKSGLISIYIYPPFKIMMK